MNRTRPIKKSFYLNSEENDALKKKCIKTGLKECNLFRMWILGDNIKEKPDEKFYDILDQLRGIATNINQIARAKNMGDDIDVTLLKEFEVKVKKIITDLRKKYL